jgi:trehalose 6-phosphate phosphatase
VPSGLLARLREAPAGAAVLLDVDGVLAPIVRRPEDARVPDKTRRELERLRDRYAVVACVSGRTSADAERIVGVPGLIYLGSHGLELAPDAKRWEATIHGFAAGVDWPVEDKGLTVSFHYREADDQAAARAELEQVAERARAIGLKARFGRKVLELLPPITANKGTAVASLLEDRALGRALYAGDDTTDLDAFRALDGLELGICVAVTSPEGPASLLDAADIVVASPAKLLDLLRTL